MSSLWKLIYLVGVFLLGAMAVIAIWFESVPDMMGKAFVSLVVVGLALLLTQSLMKPRSNTPPD